MLKLPFLAGLTLGLTAVDAILGPLGQFEGPP